MPTTKARINISVSSDMKRALSRLAKRDQMPTATKAGRMLELALELEEDIYFENLARKRLRGKTRWIPDTDRIWK